MVPQGFGHSFLRESSRLRTGCHPFRLSGVKTVQGKACRDRLWMEGKGFAIVGTIHGAFTWRCEPVMRRPVKRQCRIGICPGGSFDTTIRNSNIRSIIEILWSSYVSEIRRSSNCLLRSHICIWRIHWKQYQKYDNIIIFIRRLNI